MSDIKVSIITPVYNTSDYLRQSLDSMAGQTLAEIQIICVDDGSTDNSPEILAEYAEKDPRFLILHQENKYAGAARNLGLKHAEGKYVAFWDSDDYFDTTALEKMYLKSEEDAADICLCDGRQYYEEIDFETEGGMYLMRKMLPGETPFSAKTNPDTILNVINAAPWTKMFRREFISDLGIEFPGYKTGEDFYFVECALALADRVTYVDEPLVCYRRRSEGSLVGTLMTDPFDTINAWLQTHDYLAEKGALPEKSFANKVMNSMVYMLRNMAGSYEAFMKAVNYLKEEGLERLSVNTLEEGDFYEAWHADCLKHLKEDRPEDFMGYLFAYTYRKLTQANAKRVMQAGKAKKAKAKVKELKEELKSEKKEFAKEHRSLTEKISILDDECGALKAENASLKEELETAKKKLDEVMGSNSYKVGHALMWLPGKIKNG